MLKDGVEVLKPKNVLKLGSLAPPWTRSPEVASGVIERWRLGVPAISRCKVSSGRPDR